MNDTYLWMPAASKALSDVVGTTLLDEERNTKFRAALSATVAKHGKEATVSDLPEPWRTLTVKAMQDAPINQ